MRVLFLLLAILAIVPAFAQNKADNKVKIPSDKGFEMKRYYLVLLHKGPKRASMTDTALINKIQAGHLANISRLADMGKIIVAGPCADDTNLRGIFIFDCHSQIEVEDLLATDPAIAAGRLSYEIHPWMTGKNCVFR